MNKYTDCDYCGGEAKWVEQDGREHTYKCFECLGLTQRYEDHEEIKEQTKIYKVREFESYELEEISKNSYRIGWSLWFFDKEKNLYQIWGTTLFTKNGGEIQLNETIELILEELEGENYDIYDFQKLHLNKEFSRYLIANIKREI